MRIPGRSINVEVVDASSDQEPVLANLLKLYIHDFSEFVDVKLDANGRFGYPQLSLYWTDPDRHPFFIMVDRHLAGFAFVRKGSQISGDVNIWDMAEFFIVRGYRRLGIGKQAAHEVWKKFPGTWEVRVMVQNQEATKFWRRAISEFIGKATQPVSVEKYEKLWHVFKFESQPVA